MEGLNKENGAEKKGISLVLDKEKLRAKFWGSSQEVAAAEYIKIFFIIKHIKEKGILTENEIKETVEDLFQEFKITEIEYTDIFTQKVIDQILNSPKIDSILVDFNNAIATIDSNSTVNSVTRMWSEEWERIHAINSPESIVNWEKEQTRRKEAAQKEQAILDKMLIELPATDFSNQEKIIDWLLEYYSHYSDGVNMHDDEVIEKFKAHGYSPEHNDVTNGMLGEVLKDKNRLGKVIIGYILENGTLAVQRNDWLKNSIKNWKGL